MKTQNATKIAKPRRQVAAVVSKLTSRQKIAINSLAWGMKHFSGLSTGRQLRRSTVMSLIEIGLAESAGQCVACDGDGFTIEPERWSEAYRLTKLGSRVYEVMCQMDHERIQRAMAESC